MELLFAGIVFTLFPAHVACANYNRRAVLRLEDEEHRQIPSAKGLAESNVHILAFGIPFFRKADAGAIQ